MDGASNDRWLMIPMDYDRDLEADIGKAAGLTVGEMSDLWALRDKVARPDCAASSQPGLSRRPRK